MRIFRITFWLLLAAALAANAPAQTPTAAATALPYKSFHAKILVTAAGVSGIPSEVWFRAPDRFRMVNLVMGRQMISIMVGREVFTYPQGMAIGVKMNRAAMPGGEMSADQLLRRAVEWKQHGRKSGSETIHRRPCDIYEFTETVTGRDTSGKVWLWTANGFPLRAVTGAGEMTVTDIELNVALSDALFCPPPDVQFQDFGGLGPELLRQRLGGTQP